MQLEKAKEIAGGDVVHFVSRLRFSVGLLEMERENASILDRDKDNGPIVRAGIDIFCSLSV